MSRRLRLLVLASVLASAPAACRQADGPAPAERTTLRVLDVNVWSGLDYAGVLRVGEYEPAAVRARRRELLLRQIRALDPDVIGVHEANQLPSYAEHLARDLGYAEVHHMGVGGIRAGPLGLPWNLREGDVLLAKPDLRLQDFERVRLSGGYVGSFFAFHFGDATQMLCGTVTLNRRPLALCSTHWHSSPLDLPETRAELERLRSARRAPDGEYREALREIADGAAWRMAEARKTLEALGAHADRTVVLFGDFNAVAESSEIRALTRAGFVDTFSAVNPGRNDPTWDPTTNLNQRRFYLGSRREPATLRDALSSWFDGTPRRIDHIFLRAAPSLPLRPRSSRVVIDEAIGGQHASDHYGIFTEFEVGR